VTIEAPNRSSRIEGTTIAHNTSDAEGGGLAIDFTEGVVGVVNTTIVANDSGAGGGGVWAVEVGALKLSSVTVARNSASQGGGLFSQTPTFRVQNSIVALNHATGTGNDCGDGGVIGQAFDSLGHNLLSDLDGCDGFDAAGDIVRADPGLGALGSHGGPTQTASLLRGSPAIGHAKRGTSPKRDQRRVPRDRKPDAGAFER
jgi:fibronectin-binding autotransporter adhesin